MAAVAWACCCGASDPDIVTARLAGWARAALIADAVWRWVKASSATMKATVTRLVMIPVVSAPRTGRMRFTVSGLRQLLMQLRPLFPYTC